MAFANDYRQYYPWQQAANPAQQGAAVVGNAGAAQAAYEANQQRLAAQAAWQAQQQAAAPNTYANRAELERELAYNENEIKALQNELERMRAQWGDLDSMDRQLAANRARVGDFGNARAHQNDIIARQNDRNRVADTAMQWRWQASQNRISREADQRKQAKADIRRLIGEIEDVGVQIPYQTDPGAKNQLEAKRARLIRELDAYGVTYSDPTPATGNSNFATTLTNEEASYKNKNNRFKDADGRAKIAKAYHDLGLLAEEKRVMETPTEPEWQQKKKDWEVKRQQAAKVAEKYMNLDANGQLAFKLRWNDGKDDEIKLLKKFYTLDFNKGGLIPKTR